MQVYVSRSLRKHCLAFSVLYCPTELIQIEYYSLTAPFMIKESKYFYFLYIYFDYFNRIIQVCLITKVPDAKGLLNSLCIY